jgi:hypothetical protein
VDNKRLKQAAESANEGLWRLLAKAEERYKPFLKLDFPALAQDPTISPEDFKAFGAAAKEAGAAYDFLVKALNYRAPLPLMTAIPARKMLIEGPPLIAGKPMLLWRPRNVACL